MLIIPFDKRLDWRNPPVITLLLIIINSLIYVAFQSQDDQKLNDAQSYHVRSGLASIEIPYFKASLKPEDRLSVATNMRNNDWFFIMETNATFMGELNRDEIITIADPNYQRWKEKRRHLNQLLDEISTWSYSLKAAEPTLLTLVSHMFLHGDFGHLLGNMLFLLAVGFIVELAMAKSVYLSAYLFCGVMSGLFYIPSAADSLIPSVGASGAIAGLMGMYAVLFHTRRVRFFYFIYIYFDYVKLPAIYLLALWLGYEVFQQLSYSHMSNVNYLAHIGGLISGATLAFILTRTSLKQFIKHDYLNENESTKQFERLTKQARTLIHDLDYTKAVPVLAKLVNIQPNNTELLYQYYNASKTINHSAAHHLAAELILSLKNNDPTTLGLITDTFNEYYSVKDAKLANTQLQALFEKFISNRMLEPAENAIRLMRQQPQSYPNFPKNLQLLTYQLIQQHQMTKAKSYLALLQQYYPNHSATRITNDMLS